MPSKAVKKGEMISIIIPTYNRANLLPRAIDSIVAQTYTNWEIIIVDDGSTDDTQEVVSEYLSDRRIKFIQKKNTGASDSRNVGAKNATGEWLTFLDSDDEAFPYWLSCFSQFIKDQSNLVSAHSGVIFSGSNDKIFLPEKHFLFPRETTKFTNGGSYILSKKAFLAVGGFLSSLNSGEHTELGIRVLEYSLNNSLLNIHTNECLVKINDHNGDRLSENHKAKLRGAKIYLKLHHSKFNNRMMSRYLSIAAYNARKLGKKEESIRHAKNAVIHSKNIKLLLRYLLYKFTNYQFRI